MKKFVLASVGLLMAFSAVDGLMAQTCTAVSPDLVSGSNTVNGNNCAAAGGGTGDTSIAALCDGNSNTGPVLVYTWLHGATAGGESGSITVTPTGATPTFNPAMVIADGADCTTALNATFCDVSVADTAGAGAAESISLTGGSGTGTANTRYFLFVTSLSSVANQKCGPFSLTVGTLPVKLQSFSVN